MARLLFISGEMTDGLASAIVTSLSFTGRKFPPIAAILAEFVRLRNSNVPLLPLCAKISENPAKMIRAEITDKRK
jgi:hypothetical protein